MQIREIQGKVSAVADRDNKPYYSICIDDEWFTGDQTLNEKIGKGDTVKLAVKDDDEFIDIEGIKKIQDGQENSNRSEQLRSKSDGGVPENPLTRDQQIRKSLAFKTAVQQVDRRSCETEDDYRDMLKNLTSLHEEVLDEAMTE